jgi:hypothetical protein
MARKD